MSQQRCYQNMRIKFFISRTKIHYFSKRLNIWLNSWRNFLKHTPSKAFILFRNKINKLFFDIVLVCPVTLKDCIRIYRFNLYIGIKQTSQKKKRNDKLIFGYNIILLSTFFILVELFPFPLQPRKFKNCSSRFIQKFAFPSFRIRACGGFLSSS